MKEVLLTSSVLILVLTALRFLFRNSISRRLQYALWLLVGLRLLIPAPLLPFSSFSVMTGAEALSHRWESSAVQTAPDSTAEPVTGATTFGFAELPDVAVTPSQNTPVTEDAPQTVNAEASAPTEVTLTWTEIAQVVWGIGAAAVLVWLLVVNLKFRQQLRKTRQAVEVDGSLLPVYVTDAIVSPCLFGLFRPAVYLTPRALESEESLRHVLTHELCHYRHGDHIWSLVRSALLAVYWFDPFVWLAAALSRADSELACDEAVLRKLGTAERLAYGKTLVDMVAVRRTPTGILCAATTMTSGKRSLKERLGRIVQKPKVVIPAVIAVVVLALVCAACTFSGAETTDAESGEPVTDAETDQAAASEVTFTLAKVENGVVTPLNDPDSYLAGDIFFDAMVRSAAADAVELPDTYYLLTSTETPDNGSEPTVREYQIFRLYDGIGPFDRGTPVMQHGEQYTAIHEELMARLDAAANPLSPLPSRNPDPKASAHQDVLIDYADDNTVIFHGFFGLFVYDRATGAVTHSLDLDTAIGTSQVYDTSDSYAEVAVSQDGRVLRVAARGDADPMEALWIDTASWTGGHGPWAELRNPFDGGKSTVTTAQSETISIDLGGGLIGDVQLVAEDGTYPLFTGVQAAPTDLDSAIKAAVTDWCGDQVSDNEFLTEAHWLLGTEESADNTVKAYAYVVFLAFSGDEYGIQDSGIGGTMPLIFTFQRDENGVLQLTDLWQPKDGNYYGLSIGEAFPGELTDAALNFSDQPGGDSNLLSLYQSCYAQAVSHFHLSSGQSLGNILESQLDQLTQNLDQGRENNVADIPYRTLRWYGDDTLRYIIPQLLAGNITDSRKAVMEELIWTIHPGDTEDMTSPNLVGEASFADLVDYTQAMANQYGVEYFAGNRTASILLWNLGYSVATMSQYEEIDRLVDTICSTPAEASSSIAYFAEHPIETRMLQSYYQGSNDATLRYCIYAFLRGDSEGLRGAVLWSLMENLLGDEAIPYTGSDGQDYFNHWRDAVLQAYEQNSEGYLYRNYPKGTILLQCMGLLDR